MKTLVSKFTDVEAEALRKFMSRTSVDDAKDYGLNFEEYHVLHGADFNAEYRGEREADGKVLHTVNRLLSNTSQLEHMGAGLSKRQADALYYLYEEMSAMGYDALAPHPSLAVPA